MIRLLVALTVSALALVPLPGPAQGEPEDPAIEVRDPDRPVGCSQETAAVDAAHQQLFAAEPESLMWDLYYEVYVEAKVAEAACVAQWEGICGAVGQLMLKFARDDLEITGARYSELVS